MDIINNNPYRFLGVYSNSPTKERVANKGKMSAFLKVGKQVSFSLDLPNLLPSIIRDVASVADAESKLTLQVDQIRYAQFWWMKASQLDSIAFNHLSEGNLDMAVSIWEKKDNASSLQNRFLLSVIKENWDSAIRYAEKLYTDYSDEFVSAIVGESITVSTPTWQMLIDSLVNEKVNVLPFMDIIKNEEWKNYLSEKIILPLIDVINSAIDTAKSSRGKGPANRLKAGQKLMISTKNILSQLGKCLKISDIRYQTIVDKLATEILQCGIDYYNDTTDDDSATNAMKLQKYALTISVGSMTKQRCKENVDVLQEVVDNLPPTEVLVEHKAIKKELSSYCLLPDKIVHAVTLLNNTKPHLLSIKRKLGVSNDYYLKISTQVVGNALHNVIEEVNAAQSFLKIIDKDTLHAQALIAMQVIRVKSVLEEAWKVTKIMDTFDLEPDFKSKRYDVNRRTLRELCTQLGVSTSSVPKFKSSYGSNPEPKHTPPEDYPPNPNHSTSDNTPWGCIIAVVVFIIIFLISKCN